MPLEEGWNLRVVNLGQGLSSAHNVHLASFRQNIECLDKLESMGIFSSINVLPDNGYKPSLRRFLRFNNYKYYRLAYPEYYRVVKNSLLRLIKVKNIELIVVSRLNEAEFVVHLDGVAKVIDDFDCQTLTLEREYSVTRHKLSLKERLRYKFEYYRCSKQESELAKRFDLITTISRADQHRLQELTSNTEKIEILPNGVNPIFIAQLSEYKECEKAVAFWGNLAFRPNASAVEYFYKKIFVPYLAKKNVRWYIIGKEANDVILNYARKHDNIIVTGFVEDLVGFVENIPVVINPMIMGSGIKNKVLEAFALGRAVVSTRLGMEAVAEATPDIHYLEADSPRLFADLVLSLLSDKKLREKLGRNANILVTGHYTWEKIGERWRNLLERVIE